MTQEQDPKKNSRGLTIKQKVWLEEYLQCWNGAEAARRAGYKHPKQRGYENVTKSYLQEEIHKRLAVKCMGADEVLMRLAEQARANIGMFFTENEDGQIVVDWPVILSGRYGHLVRSISFTRAGPKIEVYDAQHALAHLAKHHRLLVDRVEMGGDPDAPFMVKYVNDWRPNNPTLPAPGPADGQAPGEAVQLAGSGETLAQDDAGHGDSGGEGA